MKMQAAAQLRLDRTKKGGEWPKDSVTTQRGEVVEVQVSGVGNTSQKCGREGTHVQVEGTGGSKWIFCNDASQCFRLKSLLERVAESW